MEKHWTEESSRKFSYRITADFFDEIQEKLEELGLSQMDLAVRMGVSESQVSEIFDNPLNLTIDLIIRSARAVGLKVAIMAYNDGDSENVQGPIYPEVFLQCWKRYSKPKDFDELKEALQK